MILIELPVYDVLYNKFFSKPFLRLICHSQEVRLVVLRTHVESLKYGTLSEYCIAKLLECREFLIVKVLSEFVFVTFCLDLQCYLFPLALKVR